MKNRLLRFYLFNAVMALALFSCENHNLAEDDSGTSQNILDRKPESRHPLGPTGLPSENQKGKKTPRRVASRSSNWC